jgi:hypothetical protein
VTKPDITMPCVDCDGTLHLLTLIEDEVPLQSGEVLIYRCDSCMERFDVIWQED